MGCPCKGNKKPHVDELEAFQLIKKGIIDEIKLSDGEKNTLFHYYNEIYNETLKLTCGNCWEDKIRDKLKELWIRKSSENQPN